MKVSHTVAGIITSRFGDSLVRVTVSLSAKRGIPRTEGVETIAGELLATAVQEIKSAVASGRITRRPPRRFIGRARLERA